jgi:arylsulfatase A
MLMIIGNHFDPMAATFSRRRTRRFAWLRIGSVALVAFMAALIAGGSSSAAAERPNVIVIMADDLGYETIGANGGTSYRTPVLDQLAAGGARFDHCYVQPLCTPTRVQLMTGAYNVRNYVTFGQMDPALTTFGNLFQSAGYATCITGKWQLGNDADLPKTFGFDESCLWQHTRRPPRYANPGLEINGVEKDYDNGEYGPELVNDYARDFVTRHKDKPFFLYYPMILTHSPYQPTPDSETWDPQAKGEKVNQRAEHFGHMVEYMDMLIGRLIATLDENNLRQNTLLIFIGDNGTGAGTTSQMGDRAVVGGKGSTTAAGMHVPCIVSWPAAITSPRVSQDLLDGTDILPTICDAAGIPVSPELTIDGRSFLPQLRGETGNPRQWVYCWYSPRGDPLREFAFDRQFKLYRTGEFYDLAGDRGERQPLRVADLKDAAAIAAARRLQAALDQFADARPAHLPRRDVAGKSPDPADKNTRKNGRKARTRD